MSTKRALKQAQDDLSALQADLPKIEGLLAEHTEALKVAKQSGATYEKLAALQAKRSGFESVLAQHRAEIGELNQKVGALQSRYDQETTESHLKAAREQHEALTLQHRDAVRALLTELPERLKHIANLETAIFQVRREIGDLGVALGIYHRNELSEVVGTNFPRLSLSHVPKLFDATFPELVSDQHTLTLLEQITKKEAVVKAGLTRLAIAERQAESRAKAARGVAEMQATAQAQRDERQAIRNAQGYQ